MFLVRMFSVALMSLIGVTSISRADNACRLLFDPMAEVYVEFSKANLRGRRTSYHTLELPRVSLNSIENLRWIESGHSSNGYAGGNNRGIRRGTYAGTEVLVKFCDLRYGGKGGLSEASLAKLMSDLGIGPEFYGVIRENGQPIGFVTRFINGVGVKHQHLTGKSKKKSARIRHFLYSIGLYPSDLQYRRDYDGRLWVVDTGEFMTGGSQELKLDSLIDELQQVHEAMTDHQ